MVIVTLLKGNTLENDAYLGKAGELTADTELMQLRLHDGVTQGGLPLPRGSDVGWDKLLTPEITSGSVTLDLASPSGFLINLSSNLTELLFTNAPAGRLIRFTIVFKQDAVGGRTVTWGNNVMGSPPQPATGADTLTIVSLVTVDGGVTFHVID